LLLEVGYLGVLLGDGLDMLGQLFIQLSVLLFQLVFRLHVRALQYAALEAKLLLECYNLVGLHLTVLVRSLHLLQKQSDLMRPLLASFAGRGYVAHFAS